MKDFTQVACQLALFLNMQFSNFAMMSNFLVDKFLLSARTGSHFVTMQNTMGDFPKTIFGHEGG